MTKRCISIDPISDGVLGVIPTDLGRNYQESGIREALRGRLTTTIKHAHEAGRRIMVVGHSIGSIIAYDTLRTIGRERRDIVIDHLVALGNPLGLPNVKYQIWKESDRVRTSSIESKWTNLAERRDIVPERDKPERINYHSGVGYLRTPEMSRLIRDFL